MYPYTHLYFNNGGEANDSLAHIFQQWILNLMFPYDSGLSTWTPITIHHPVMSSQTAESVNFFFW